LTSDNGIIASKVRKIKEDSMIQLPNAQELLQKEMNRKEFLQHVGIGVLGVVGVTALISNLEKFFNPKKENSESQSGYGYSPYGK